MPLRILIFLGLVAVPLLAGLDPEVTAQKEFEQTIDAVVRQKNYYKAGHLELDLVAGGMPYDALVDHLMYGPRVAWHISDHWGWEIIDAQFDRSKVSGYARNNIVFEKGLSNLQVLQIGQYFGTGLLASPLYGKVHFFGRQVLYFDIYLVAGLGASYAQTIKLSNKDETLSSNYYPMASVGFGLKIFASSAVGLVVDFRDYIIQAPLYDTTRIHHNLAVLAGLNIYFPGF